MKYFELFKTFVEKKTHANERMFEIIAVMNAYRLAHSVIL